MRRLLRPYILSLLAACGLLAGPAAAQAPLRLVNEQTEVRSIRFRFVDGQTFEPATLKEQIALTEQQGFLGSVALRRRLSFLPFVTPVGFHPFLPVEMAKDAVRIERYYNRNGFLHPEVTWLVNLDTTRNTVGILYTVREGPPLILQSLDFRGPDGRPAYYQFPDALQENWIRFRDDISLATGRRLDDFALIRLQDRALAWVRDQGYPFAEVDAATNVDSLANTADVTILLDAGPRARISEVLVEGAESVRQRVVRRELPFRRGDLFSYSALVEGQRQVFGLNLFQIALADVPEDQPQDSSVVVRLRVREGPPRVVAGGAGYLSEGGLRGQVQWTHRNFLGGARTLTASAFAETGFLAFTANPSRRYRGEVSLREPYVFNRNLAAILSPFAEYRDDERDESWQAGADATLLYERDQLRTASARLSYQAQRVLEFRANALTGGLFGLFESEVRDSLDGRIDRFTLGLAGTYGIVDQPVDPRSGFVLRPTAEVTLPVLTSIEFGRLGGSASAYLPITETIGLFGRVSGGRLLPFGKSIPAGGETDALVEYLRLRDVVYLGGGTSDVRGWGNGLLGPKLPDLREVERVENGDTVTEVEPERRYVPVGGLAKFAGTLEARLPFPFLGESWGTFVFLDAGRVWTPDDRFDILAGGIPEAEVEVPEVNAFRADERFFFSTGGGISFATPVGALRFSVGYKLNPSPLDLRAPQDVARAVYEDLFPGPPTSLDEIDENPWKRFHLHLSIGQTF